MKKYFLLLSLSLFLFNCNRIIDTKYQKYDFEFKGNTYNGQPYKFSKEIEEVELKEKGHQFASWEYSYIGNNEKVLKLWNINSKETKKLSDEEIEQFGLYTPHSAIPYIINQANKHQITIINEAHHKPQHRVFTTKLLEKLYDGGYRHLGLETLLNNSKTDSLIQIHRYPVMENGYYIKEPQFGNLIRRAIEIGFKLFSYESLSHSTSKEREINQAKNISKYMATYPNEKILIHCGFAHAEEGILNNKWEKAMAGRLSEFTGINPLTINQTIYSEKDRKEVENPYYQLTNVSEPTIYINNNGNIFGKEKGNWYDIFVFHPRTKDKIRPEWLLHGNRKKVILNLEKLEIEFPCLVLAYLGKEEIGYAVPYDVVETNNKKVTLILEQGKYNIIILNHKNESVLIEKEIKN